MLACSRACVFYYNTKPLDAVLYKWPYLGTGCLNSVRASSQSDQALLFRILSEMDVHIYDTHWITGNTKKRKKKQEDNVTGSYNAEISLYKAIPFKIQHLYCLKYKITISRTRLNLSLFQNLWFHSLVNVLLNSYHVTAIPSLNHSLLDAQRFAALK